MLRGLLLPGMYSSISGNSLDKGLTQAAFPLRGQYSRSIGLGILFGSRDGIEEDQGEGKLGKSSLDNNNQALLSAVRDDELSLSTETNIRS